MMNMFIYTENGDLHIRKPNGLEYCFNNTDKPNLGFEYDVVIYDDDEFKIVQWEDGKTFDEQVRERLTDTDIDAIETYIANSEAPAGVSLSNQYSERLNNICHDYCKITAEKYGFTCVTDAVIAGRSGSNHPRRSDARRTLEYYDSIWNVYEGLIGEIQNTREDVLPEFDYFESALPRPQRVPNS